VRASVRARFARLEEAITAEWANPESPFEEPKGTTAWYNGEEIFTDSDTTGVQGAYYKITLTIKDVFDPFGGGRSR